MKKIKYILSIAILVIFAIGCTNEDDFDSTNSKTNDKSLPKSDYSPLSPYPEYEQINITAQKAMNLLVDFNKAMNNEVEMPDMEVNEALLAMEMYFNYAIVDKQVNSNQNKPYEGQEFEFTVNIDDKIVGTELKAQYRDFLIEITDVMANKFLRFSDMFVSAKTGSTITFKIIIPPFLDCAPDHNVAMMSMPSCSIVREVGDIVSVPSDVVIDWSVYFEGWVVVDPSVGNQGFPYWRNNSQELLHSYCIKSLDAFVYGIITTYGPLNSYSISQYYFLTNGYDENYEVNDESFSYMQVFDNENIMNYLIPATLVAADSFRQILSPGHTLIDIDIKLDFGYYANFIYTFAFGGLKILGYKSSHLISWIELESADIGSIKFLN